MHKVAVDTRLADIYLRVMGPVPAVYRHVSSLDWWGHLWSVGPLRGVSLIGSYWPMGRWRGNRVHCLVRNINHGLGTGQSPVPREGALLIVELTLLPLVQLPHRVVSHWPSLLLGARPHCFVMRGRGSTAETLRPGLAVSWECSIPFRVSDHDLGSVAWHISW